MSESSAPAGERLHVLKGHGTRNDFVLVPDPDGTIGALHPDLVRALCDRRSGIGADGVIRVVRTTATDDPATQGPESAAAWFMDYVNADGSTAEMCGNGVRVMARYLIDREGADPDGVAIATRAGVRTVVRDGDRLTVDMGRPQLLGETEVGVGGRRLPAHHVSMGNPHAVAFVQALDDAGPLLEPPWRDESVFPDGVNVEFVERAAPGHLRVRIHERGSGETESCGTGVCAAAVAAAAAVGDGRGASYTVSVAGGDLRVDWTEDDRVLLTGPAVIVAEGYWLAGL